MEKTLFWALFGALLIVLGIVSCADAGEKKTYNDCNANLTKCRTIVVIPYGKEKTTHYRGYSQLKGRVRVGGKLTKID